LVEAVATGLVIAYLQKNAPALIPAAPSAEAQT
jgi:hypothetical protein